MFEQFTAAQYRALDHDAFVARKQVVLDLLNADTLPEGVTDEMLFAEADLIEADEQRRSRANKLFNSKVEAVASGAGSVIASTGEGEQRAMPKAEPQFQARAREASEHYTDSKEYRTAVAKALLTRGRLDEAVAAKVRQERATQAVDIPGDFTNIADPTFANQDSNTVAIPYSLNAGFVRELREKAVLFNLVNHVHEKGQLGQREADLHLEFTWLGSNDKIVSLYQGDEDPTVFHWAWNMLECRHSRTFLAEALMADDFKGLLAEELADGYALAMDEVIVRGTGNMQPRGILTDERLVGTDGKGKNFIGVDGTVTEGAGGGTALFIEVNDGMIDDWKFWSTILYKDEFNPLYQGNGTMLLSRGTWGNHVDVLHDDNNRPISLYNPVGGDSQAQTLRGVGPVSLTPNTILPSYDRAEVGDVFGIFGNLKNYTMNTQPGMPMSIVTWDDHENNAHKTKLLVACDGRVSNRYGWVFLVKGANA